MLYAFSGGFFSEKLIKKISVLLTIIMIFILIFQFNYGKII